MMAEKRKLTAFHISVYLITFFSVWSIREIIIRPVFLDTLDGAALQITKIAMKLLIWTLPAVLLIKRYQDDMSINLKEMFTNKPAWFKGAPVLALVIIVPFAQAWVSFGALSINPDFQPVKLIETVLFVGITEEIVFRGFLLNATLKKMKLLPAIILNAVLFALIHFPVWIYLRHDIATFVSGSISIMGLSALFAFSFVRTKNIIVPMSLHMIWNLLIVVFFGD